MFEKLKIYYNNFLDFLPQLSLGLVVLAISFILAMIIRRVIIKRLKPLTKNPLLLNFIGKIIALSVNIFGIILFLGIIGLGDVSSKILAGAGILTFVVGFAFKDIGENFLSGILLAFKSPFGINDLIETEKTLGYVTEVSFRETVIKTLDGKDVFIPNSQILKNPLINYTVDGFLRYEFVLSFDSKTDLSKVTEIIESCLSENEAILKDEKKPMVTVEDLLDKKINLRVSYWIDTFHSKSKDYHINIKSKLLKDISEALKVNGIQ